MVTGVAQGDAFCQLCGLGVHAGAEVEIVRQLSRRNMLVARVDGSDMAVTSVTASTIKVRPE